MAIDATDAAVKLAKEHDLDLGQVTGTGTGDRITKADVEAAIARQAAQQIADALEPRFEAETAEDVAAEIDVAVQAEPETPFVRLLTSHEAAIQQAGSLQQLIRLADGASDEERAAIRARAKELLTR